MINTIGTLAAYGFVFVMGIFVTAAQVMNLKDRRKRNKR
jgi:hypothetical protein